MNARMDGLDATLLNFEGLVPELASLGECARVHLAEASRELVRGRRAGELASDPDTFRAEYRSLADRVSALCDTADSALGENARLLLCSYIAREAGVPDNPALLLTSLSPGEDAPAGSRVSYLRNPVSDVAYERFSSVLGNASVLYGEDFTAVCENLYHAQSDYAILPVESSREGRLSHFELLIDKYELHIVCVCRVEQTSDMSYTTFALLSKSLMSLEPLSKANSLFSFEITGGEVPAHRLLFAARFFGAKLVRLGLAPAEGGRERLSCVFDLAECEVSGLICFLALEAPGFAARGLYFEI